MENYSTQIPKFPNPYSRFQKFPVDHLLLLLVLTFSATTAASPQFSSILYSEHCGDVVPESAVSPDATPDPKSSGWLALQQAYIAGGDLDSQSDPDATLTVSQFSTQNVYRTQKDGIYKLEGFISISRVYGQKIPIGLIRRGLRVFNYRNPRFPRAVYPPFISLAGFWNSVTGQLCMVGADYKQAISTQFALKLNYLNSSTIFDSFVNGSFERFDAKNESYHSNPLKISGFSLRHYRYSLIDKEVEKNIFNAYDIFVNDSLELSSKAGLCTILSYEAVELEYSTNCNGVNCDLYGGIHSNFTPYGMYFNKIECSKDGEVRLLLSFSNLKHNDLDFPFDQNVTLVAEGKWDINKRRLDMVACRVLNGSDVSGKVLIGDCTVRLSLRMPSRWTLRERSIFVGNIWSTKSSKESGYFRNMVFRSMSNMHSGRAGLVYKYTEIERARSLCANKMISKGKEGKYPKAHSSDMRFDTILRNKNSVQVWAYSSPLTVGENNFNIKDARSGTISPTAIGKDNISRVFNISFLLQCGIPTDFLFGANHSQHSANSLEFFAEGLYDSKTGHLCMIGCMDVASHNRSLYKKYMDCEVQVDIQYAPLNAKGGTSIRGTIESLRVKSDRFYFEPLEILSTSLYKHQAQESIWRMDLEMTLVLVSNTLVCVFVGLQLLYVKNHPNALPFISVIMMVLLTTAHMIPLLLNFEALFLANRNKQNLYLGGDGWLEVNEVLVRGITMVAFLLEFRLLQLTWSARASVESQKSLWTADKKVMFLSLPLYSVGGLIALCVHISREPHQRRRLALLHRFHKIPQQTLWGALKSYAGLILDGFLLPQILFNLFCNTNERALSPIFYLGSTLVRLMPHVYDLYRAHSSSTWTWNHIYADPKLDYYSTFWDIIICCGGVLFVSLVFLQQLFGGRCFLPRRFRDTAAYEKVPTVSAPSDEGS